MSFFSEKKVAVSSRIILQAGCVLDRTPRKVLIMALLLFQVLIHWPFLDRPPAGVHLWRQTQTLAVARNFAEEGLNPFLPRVDARGIRDGVTGMEFPLVNVVIAIGYRLFGFSHFAGRLVLLGFSLAAVMACFLLLERRFTSRSTATVGTLFLICSPMFAYYSIVAVPDIAGLAFLLAALFLLDESEPRRLRYRLPLGMAMLTMAGLVKITTLIAIPLVVFRLWQANPRRMPRIIQVGGIAVVLGVVGAWYFYARYLCVLSANNDFKLESAFPYPLREVPRLVSIILLNWLPEFYITYGTLAFLLVGGVVLISGKAGRSPVWEGLFAAGVLAFLVAELPMLDVHDYYMVVALPLLVSVAAHGWRWLTRPEMGGRVHMMALLLLAVIVALGPARGLGRFGSKPPRPDLLAIERCLDGVIPGRSVKIIAASDISPSIYLYFMHRKGWAINDEVDSTVFHNMVCEGAQYLVSDSRALERRPEISAYLGPALSQCGPFKVVPLALPKINNQ